MAHEATALILSQTSNSDGSTKEHYYLSGAYVVPPINLPKARIQIVVPRYVLKPTFVHTRSVTIHANARG